MFLEKIIEICANKSEFKELLLLATKDSHLIFDGTLYKQIDGATMSFPLDSALANAFLVYHEKKCLKDCPLKLTFYCRMYVENIFALFN